jgi:type VI secretion system secreted protein VgrG
VTPRPRVEGTQTAVVVGPAGELVFCDKYGRVKVQFHWDREGQNDLGSSCWLRVTSPWAGKRRGVIYVPMIGDEVVVAFLEGDLDQPIIIGSVYNAEMMPPYELPANNQVAGYKGRTGSNQVKIQDIKGKEFVNIESDKNMSTIVHGDKMYTEVANGAYELAVKGQVWIRSSEEIKLDTGSSSLLMKADGTIELKGVIVTSQGTTSNTVKGGLVNSEAVTVNTIKGPSLVKINC